MWEGVVDAAWGAVVFSAAVVQLHSMEYWVLLLLRQEQKQLMLLLLTPSLMVTLQMIHVHSAPSDAYSISSPAAVIDLLFYYCCHHA